MLRHRLRWIVPSPRCAAGSRDPDPYRERVRTPPLPVRDGLNPSRLRLPESGPWATTLEYLLQRFYDDQVRIRQKVGSGEVVDAGGTPIDPGTPFDPDSFVFLYRDPAPERRVPFEIDIIYRDSDLLVIDKPHFLATMPRGFYIVESALVRLRRELDLPQLSPLHRLDRVTAGVLMFSLRPEQRGAYQQLFAHRKVTKYYEAVAPYRNDLPLPRTVRSRIVKERGTPTADEVPGEPNSATRVELLDVRGTNGLYGLHPATGKTHQLRIHMCSLGLPIHGDNFYPRLLDLSPYDYSSPLQLVARSVAFDDPFSGEPRRFESRRTFATWPDP
jgi:tRNA pseudouridine32 synthase/23S rRNA pseudouridine746 synthase